MLVAELQELEEVKTLVTRGQQLGVLTLGDVATAVSEVELDESDVEDLYGHLEKAGIELVEDLDPAQKAAAENERSDGKRGRKRQKAALDLKPDMTTDSLQLFLKDIGKVRLLTAAEEVELAKRIERGDLDAKQNAIRDLGDRGACGRQHPRHGGVPHLVDLAVDQDDGATGQHGDGGRLGEADPRVLADGAGRGRDEQALALDPGEEGPGKGVAGRWELGQGDTFQRNCCAWCYLPWCSSLPERAMRSAPRIPCGGSSNPRGLSMIPTSST